MYTTYRWYASWSAKQLSIPSRWHYDYVKMERGEKIAEPKLIYCQHIIRPYIYEYIRVHINRAVTERERNEWKPYLLWFINMFIIFIRLRREITITVAIKTHLCVQFAIPTLFFINYSVRNNWRHYEYIIIFYFDSIFILIATIRTRIAIFSKIRFTVKFIYDLFKNLTNRLFSM